MNTRSGSGYVKGEKVKRITLKLLALIIPFHLCVSVALSLWPMKFMDGEYAWYESNRQYSLHHDEYCRVLIMGDSTAKSAWFPPDLSSDTYNFALGGTSPIEEYYLLKEYLQQNPVPEYLFYTTGVLHFTVAETLWDRSVYFHRFKAEDVYDLLKALKASGDYSAIEGNKTIEDLVLYEVYSPVKYSTAFFKGLLSAGRYDENMRKKASVEANKGYTSFGETEDHDGANYYVEYDSFQPSRLIDGYFRKIIELCEENDIHFIFENPPINTASFNGLNENFVSDYKAYLTALQKDYPSADINSELYCYDGSYFGDRTHMSKQGARLYTNKMRNKYDYIFEEVQL